MSARDRNALHPTLEPVLRMLLSQGLIDPAFARAVVGAATPPSDEAVAAAGGVEAAARFISERMRQAIHAHALAQADQLARELIDGASPMAPVGLFIAAENAACDP